MEIAIVLLAGIVSGFVNVVGGGGSLITLPVLIFLGLPSAAANGTNRVALMVQSLVAIGYFKNKGYFYPKLSVILGIPALVGSIAGAKFAISMPDELFNQVLAVVMLVVLALIILRPEKWFLSQEKGEDLSKTRLIIAATVFFGVGFYGGFIQAGVGFIIIAAMALITGMSLVKINSLKVTVALIYMASSLLVFIFSGKVDWILGLILAAGNALGAYFGGMFTVSGGDKWIRIFLVVTVSIMAAKLLGLHKIIF